MLQGKFGLIDKSLLKYPPFVAMEMQKQLDEKTACRCSSGYHTVWTNHLLGQEPTCSCEPDNPATALNQCAKLTAPNGYEYIYANGQCVLAVKYDTNTERWFSVGTNQSIVETPSTPSDLLERAKQFASEHKIAVIAALAALGYFAFSGGLAASDRTITSITRYAPRKKNPSKHRKVTRRRSYKRR